MTSRGWRLLAVAGLLVGVILVPVRQVAACDCAMTELPQAIQEAEVAIIGTLAGAGTAAPEPGVVGQPIQHVWNVERARDPMSAVTLTVAAWPNDGANCGISFEADERWLILAYQADAGLETNGCMSNVRLADAMPEQIEVIDSLVATPVAPTEAAASPGSVPTPVLVAAGALALIAAISFLAFRRTGPGASS